MRRRVCLHFGVFGLFASLWSHSARANDDYAVHREQILKWSEICDGSPTKRGCDDGDATLFNGLLCASGEELGCRSVKLAQGRDGRMWRSPRRVNRDTENSFSRDMGLGVLLYVIAKHDTKAMKSWRQYVARAGKLCPDATDNRCDTTPLFRHLFNDVAKAVGAWRYPGEDDHDEGAGDDVTLFLSAKYGELGYAAHLVAVEIYLKRALGQTTSTLEAATKALLDRQPQNLFFRWLANSDTTELRTLLNQRLPKGAADVGNQWQFEREDGEQAWQQSMGWDYVFLFNLLKTSAIVDSQ